jgi:hypothetical protein
MAKEVIKESDLNIMYHHTGTWRFTGCQCFKDCSCSEDFIPSKYNYYTVKRKNKKTTTHSTLNEAEIRWSFLENLNKQQC